ncbi:VanZ family protein [Pseudomonas knackmussii]|uniref:VanZ family protein n=1 Tax=Pseudomonas knackmussii TaxID=65741 RepID=A0ABY4KK36_9PSED|nr:VanZ family protein [Pseudomonas knackmussii]UPQ81189.1 VanZ family protein [Pseudomonas knackmussii]
MQYQHVRRMAPFVLAVLFLAIMALKDSPNSQLYLGADKLYHWLGFSILTYTAHRAFPAIRLGSLFVWILVGAASIELLQALTPSRTPSLADMTINIVGIMSGLGATQLIKPAHPKPSKRRRNSTRKRRTRRLETEQTRKEVS